MVLVIVKRGLEIIVPLTPSVSVGLEVCGLLLSLLLFLGWSLFGLLGLALLQAFVDCCADYVEDCLYAAACIVVGWNNEIYWIWVRVGIDNTEYWDTKTVCLCYSDVLFHHVYYEECAWQTCQVRD